MRPSFRSITSLPIIALALATFFPGTQFAAAADKSAAANPLELWYNKASAKWLEALPVGNGRIGVMVWGQTHHETLSLNDATCWSGEASTTNAIPEGPKIIADVRKMIAEGKWADVRKTMPQFYGRRENFGTNLEVGRLILDFVHESKQSRKYIRSLDLKTAIASVSYENSVLAATTMDSLGNVIGTASSSTDAPSFHREVFASNPDQVIVMRVTCSQPGRVTFFAKIDGGDNPAMSGADGNDLLLSGDAFETLHSDGKTGVHFNGRVRVLNEGGTVSVKDGRLSVDKANAVTLLIALNTNFLGGDPAALCKQQIEAAAAKGYDALKQAHVADYQHLFNRVSLDLGKSPHPTWPTDQRLDAVRKGQSDPALAAMLFQYARYLLISASRENSPLPMHAGGIWNDNLCARMPWSTDHHLDVNVAMTYWPAEVGNLTECTIPLANWIKNTLSVSGAITAKVQYNCRGWMADAVSNAWGYSAPGWGGWTPFVCGGTWIASHLWSHYLYTGDKQFLKDTAYPVLKGNAEFFMDYMTTDPKHGWLVTGPSISPENSFLAPDGDGQQTSWSMGPTVDVASVRQLFESCITASKILGLDPDFRDKLIAMEAKLPPFQIGKAGQLQEWLEDYTEAVPGHRHTSHLLSVYPYSEINPDDTPDLAKAARVSIERRVTAKNWEGEDSAGWSRAYITVYLARLRDREAAFFHLQKFIANFINNNLLDICWGGQAGALYPVYCLDGNGGIATAISEMLMQSYHGRILLLPTLPKQWPDGFVNGLCAMGGFEVDLKWKGGNLTQSTIRSKLGGPCTIKAAAQLTVTCDGAAVATKTENGLISFPTEAGRSYQLVPAKAS